MANSSAGGGQIGPIPFMQRLLDSPFVLLVIGVVVPALSYTVWGVIEVLQIPMAP